MAQTGYSSSAYGSGKKFWMDKTKNKKLKFHKKFLEDEKPRQINRPDLNARRRPESDSESEPRNGDRFRGAGF